MNPATVIAFLVVFAAGPLLCAAILRLPARLAVLAALAGCVGVAGLAALWVQAHGPAPVSLGLLWLAWVLAVAMVGLALAPRLRNPRARRALTITALLATTLPWFGLATARLMD